MAGLVVALQLWQEGKRQRQALSFARHTESTISAVIAAANTFSWAFHQATLLVVISKGLKQNPVGQLYIFANAGEKH